MISRALHDARVLVLIVAVAVAAPLAIAEGGGKIRGKEIAKNSVSGGKLKKKARKRFKKPGPQGPQGVQGEKGEKGDPGTSGKWQGERWSAIPRNNIGSPEVDLQPGPYGSFGVVGPSSEPPFGIGSLRMGVSDDALSGSPPDEKATFGNEVDFFGDLVTDVSAVGFQVFQTGENNAISTTNLPNITFEVDPNLDGVGANYSSLVFVPDAVPPGELNQWSSYIDATSSGGWYFTNGASATATGCSAASPCTFSALQTALANDDAVDGSPATIYTFAVGKGRDHAWFGAVDGLRLNNTIYDFEPLGVSEVAA